MELYKELLAHILAQETVQVTFPDCSQSFDRLLESACYKALVRIKSVLEDETLDDRACFQKIEEIVCIFEEIGSNAGSRHDFG